MKYEVYALTEIMKTFTSYYDATGMKQSCQLLSVTGTSAPLRRQKDTYMRTKNIAFASDLWALCGCYQTL